MSEEQGRYDVMAKAPVVARPLAARVVVLLLRSYW
jgi:hypothetical protein